jgi:hypothetical protein
MQEPLPLQAVDPAIRSRALFGENGSQAGHRTASIEDQNRLAVTDLVDKGAEVILRLGESSCLHMARIAISIWSGKLDRWMPGRLADFRQPATSEGQTLPGRGIDTPYAQL